MTKKVADEPQENTNAYPAWKYGPGGVGEIFQSADEVPEGWADHPNDALPAIDL